METHVGLYCTTYGLIHTQEHHCFLPRSMQPQSGSWLQLVTRELEVIMTAVHTLYIAQQCLFIHCLPCIPVGVNPVASVLNFKTWLDALAVGAVHCGSPLLQGIHRQRIEVSTTV